MMKTLPLTVAVSLALGGCAPPGHHYGTWSLTDPGQAFALYPNELPGGGWQPVDSHGQPVVETGPTPAQQQQAWLNTPEGKLDAAARQARCIGLHAQTQIRWQQYQQLIGHPELLGPGSDMIDYGREVEGLSALWETAQSEEALHCVGVEATP